MATTKKPDKTIKLYNGEVQIDFYERYHQYFHEGRKLLSVTGATSIIDKSAPLIYWAVGLTRDHLLEKLKGGEGISEADVIEASKQHNIQKKKAADIGSMVHQWAEQYINNAISKKAMPKLPDDENVANGVLAFLKWTDEKNVKFLASEKLVYSRRHDYVGIMDCKAIVDGKLACVDFKTGNRVYEEHLFQVSAYQAADSEETGDKFGDKWIIRFDKNTAEFNAHKFKNQQKDFQTFLACLKVRRRLNELKK